MIIFWTEMDIITECLTKAVIIKQKCLQIYTECVLSMKYVNANEVLPEELLFMIQKYYQGGYLYIPKISACEERTKTDYKIELEMRNQYIYLKHLEGRRNGQLGQIYHLSESSIRRVIAKEKVRYQNMKENIERILPLWGMEGGQLAQIYPSAWEVNHSYVIKVYEDKKQLERNMKISEVLLRCHIPAAKAALTKTGEKYAAYQNRYFLMSKKLQGSNISDRRDQAMMRKMGCAIANLHLAFLQCEREVEFWDNSLLKEMKGWVRKSLRNNDWQIIKEEEYTKTVEQLETVYDDLPKQPDTQRCAFWQFLIFPRRFLGIY